MPSESSKYTRATRTSTNYEIACKYTRLYVSKWRGRRELMDSDCNILNLMVQERAREKCSPCLSAFKTSRSKSIRSMQRSATVEWRDSHKSCPCGRVSLLTELDFQRIFIPGPCTMETGSEIGFRLNESTTTCHFDFGDRTTNSSTS